jgi:hypothetical protein
MWPGQRTKANYASYLDRAGWPAISDEDLPEDKR